MIQLIVNAFVEKEKIGKRSLCNQGVILTEVREYGFNE